jgi:predicted GTPase
LYSASDIVVDDAEEAEIEKLAQAQERKRMQQAQEDLHERITQQDIANQLFAVQQAKEHDLKANAAAHYYKGKKVPAALYGIEAPNQATIHMANEFFINNKHAVLQHSVIDEYPTADAKMPELAFIGRSNAGKSSLLNAICRSDSLASVSSTPVRILGIFVFILKRDIQSAFIFLTFPI